MEFALTRRPASGSRTDLISPGPRLRERLPCGHSRFQAPPNALREPEIDVPYVRVSAT